MSRECEITMEDGVAGVITLDDKTVTAKASPNHTALIRNIMKNPVYVDDKGTIKREDDPVGWFEGLPLNYHGSRVWAEIRETKTTDSELDHLENIC
jgi:hypothetical protein